MGVGHMAVALGAAKVAPRTNVGWYVFAALLADFLLGIFVTLGLEQAHVPPDYATRHYLTFTFPYSHGLVPMLLWGVMLGSVVAFVQGKERRTVFLLIVALVVSHFLLDGLVHVIGLPLLRENSPKFGLALWNNVPLELALETAMAAIGTVLYWQVARNCSVFNRSGILIVVLLFTAMTWGQLFLNQPPATSQLVGNWIIGTLLFSALIFALDRARANS